MSFKEKDRETFLRAKQEDLLASAKMLGSISTAALTFQDPHSAQEILRVFEADPQVTLACIYDGEGEVLASYRRAGADEGICPLSKLQAESSMDAKKMTLYQRDFFRRRDYWANLPGSGSGGCARAVCCGLWRWMR